MSTYTSKGFIPSKVLCAALDNRKARVEKVARLAEEKEQWWHIYFRIRTEARGDDKSRHAIFQGNEKDTARIRRKIIRSYPVARYSDHHSNGAYIIYVHRGCPHDWFPEYHAEMEYGMWECRHCGETKSASDFADYHLKNMIYALKNGKREVIQSIYF